MRQSQFLAISSFAKYLRWIALSFLFVIFFVHPFSLIAAPQVNNSFYDYYPRTAKLLPGDTLFVIQNNSMNNAERLLVSTLMGVLAQEKSRIYIQLGGSYGKWLQDIRERYGIFFDYTYQSHPWGLFNRFKSLLAEPAYLLCNLDASSVNVATSLSGIWRVVAVDESIEAKAQSIGLQLKMDVRGKDELWCFSQFWPQFNSGLLVQQKEQLLSLRDFGPFAKAFTFFDGNSTFMRQVMSAADDDAPILGWGDASHGEDQFVRPASENSIFTIAADHAWNLSVFSAVRVDSLYQRTHQQETSPASNVHTVTFVMSDGDNIQWLLNDFSTNEKWYGSPLRGQFDMGWTISPSMVALAPSVMDRFYRDAVTNPGKDFFVCGVSGGGYIYPSYYPDLATHCDRLNAYLQAADLNIVTILERRRGYFAPEILDHYTRQPQVLGCFYLDYAQYDYYGGKIIWSNNKPVVSARFNLWGSFDTPEYIASRINSSARDPADPRSYSFINVHPWSKSLTDVQHTIELFDNNVDVVTPEVFMNRIAMNVAREPTGVKSARPSFDNKPQIEIFPNPVTIGHSDQEASVRIRLLKAQNPVARVRIVNVLGRVAKEWSGSEFYFNSSKELIWNGRDANANSVTPGIYFVIAEMKEIVQVTKLVVLR